MTEHPVYIEQRADRLWAVRLPGHTRPAVLLQTEEEAISAARHLHPWSVARVLRRDGKTATVFLGKNIATTTIIE